MGLNIKVTERKAVRCPHCGEAVTTVDVASIGSSGRLWFDVLEMLGYYVPYEKRTEKNDWYGNDMILTSRQASRLAVYAEETGAYHWREIAALVEKAIMDNNKVVINADW